MERKKRSKGRGWESCYVKTIYGTFGVEMRAYGQKLVQFCTHTHTRVSFSSIDRLAMDLVAAARLSETEPTLFVLETSRYAFGGRYCIESVTSQK